jgi:DNA-directed RNA polymerase subunit E'/Rpb7
MISIQEIAHKINIQPHLLHNNLEHILRYAIHERLHEKIMNGSYIIDILSFKHKKSGVINNDGSVSFNTLVTCQTCSPEIGKIYKLKITHINKMGIMHKFEKVTIFIPAHNMITCDPEIGNWVDVHILGKRIEENMVCVGKEV